MASVYTVRPSSYLRRTLLAQWLPIMADNVSQLFFGPLRFAVWCIDGNLLVLIKCVQIYMREKFVMVKISSFPQQMAMCKMIIQMFIKQTFTSTSSFHWQKGQSLNYSFEKKNSSACISNMCLLGKWDEDDVSVWIIFLSQTAGFAVVWPSTAAL